MAVRSKFDLSARKLRSALTNGTAILADVDHRKPWMRRLRDLAEMHVSDLGGEEGISHSERVIVRRAAMLTLQLEMMETRFAANDGEASRAQLESYQRAANTLRRLLESVGLQRRSRDVTPSLDQYLRSKREDDDAEDAEVIQ